MLESRTFWGESAATEGGCRGLGGWDRGFFGGGGCGGVVKLLVVRGGWRGYCERGGIAMES